MRITASTSPSTGTKHPESDVMDIIKLAAALAGHQIYSENWIAAGGVSIVCVCTDVIFVPTPDETNSESELNQAFANHQARNAVRLLGTDAEAQAEAA